MSTPNGHESAGALVHCRDCKDSLARAFETDFSFAGLATSPDFGCVQGERRDEP